MLKKAVVLLAEGFEEVEAITSIALLRRAGIEITIVGVTGSTIKGLHKIEVRADKKIETVSSDYHACVLPGGMPGANNIASSGKAVELIKKMYREKKVIAAICAAPAVILSPLGLINNKRATCYPGLESAFPESAAYQNQEVVVDKNIITGQGPAAALGFALKITEELLGKEAINCLKKTVLYKK